MDFARGNCINKCTQHIVFVSVATEVFVYVKKRKQKLIVWLNTTAETKERVCNSHHLWDAGCQLVPIGHEAAGRVHGVQFGSVCTIRDHRQADSADKHHFLNENALVQSVNARKERSKKGFDGLMTLTVTGVSALAATAI